MYMWYDNYIKKDEVNEMNDLKRLNVMIPAELKVKLEQMAEDKGVNLSSLVRMILTAESKK